MKSMKNLTIESSIFKLCLFQIIAIIKVEILSVAKKRGRLGQGLEEF